MERRFLTFPRQEGSGVRVISAAIFSEAERAKWPVAIIAFLPWDEPSKGSSNLGPVQQLESKLCEAMKGKAELAGHVILSDAMKSIFYAPSALPHSVDVRIGTFKKRRIELESRNDPDWLVYQLELQPTPIERQIGQNNALHANLKQHGDIESIPRDVDLTFIFPTDTARSSFLEEVEQDGNGFSDITLHDHPPDTYACEFKKMTSVEPFTIASVCAPLVEIAENYGGQFDGWGCNIKTE